MSSDSEYEIEEEEGVEQQQQKQQKKRRKRRGKSTLPFSGDVFNHIFGNMFRGTRFWYKRKSRRLGF